MRPQCQALGAVSLWGTPGILVPTDVIWLEDKPFSLQTLEENNLLCINEPQEALPLLGSPLGSPQP